MKHKKKNLRSRTFAYEMNENKAKTKLLKGARRAEHLDIELKSTCANLRFDDGAFQEIALPLIKPFHNQINTMFRFMGHDIRVTESDAGVDNLDKHIDTKLVLFVNEERLVVHVYNTTQNVFVQGKSFANFVANCLQPYFTKRIVLIKKVNRNVEEALGKSKPIRHNVKNRGGNKIIFLNFKLPMHIGAP